MISMAKGEQACSHNDSYDKRYWYPGLTVDGEAADPQGSVKIKNQIASLLY